MRKEAMSQVVLWSVVPAAAGWDVLFPIAKVSEDSIYDVVVLNTGDDLYRSTAMTANFDIDIEYALESLGPGHRDVSFSG